MTTTQKVIYGIVGLILLGGAGWIGTRLGGVTNKYYPSTTVLGGAVGDTNQSPRMWQQAVSFASTTPISVTNPGNDRLISSIEYYVTGVGNINFNATGVAVWQWQISTSTDIYTPASTNYVLNSTVSTSTPFLFIASTTPGNTGSAQTRIWASGTNLNLLTNGTSTATGLVIIHYRQL